MNEQNIMDTQGKMEGFKVFKEAFEDYLTRQKTPKVKGVRCSVNSKRYTLLGKRVKK